MDVNFVVSKQLAEYQPPNERIRCMISQIGWDPLFSSVSRHRWSSDLDEQQKDILVDFLCSYDIATDSGYADGVQVFLTRHLVAQAFGFPVDGDGSKLPPHKGSTRFRCDLIAKDAVPSMDGLPLCFIKDSDVRTMLQIANEVLTGKPVARTAIAFGMLQAVWMSIQSGDVFDWAAFMLKNMTNHLRQAHDRLASSERISLYIGQQLFVVIQEAKDAAALFASFPTALLPISDEAMPVLLLAQASSSAEVTMVDADGNEVGSVTTSNVIMSSSGSGFDRAAKNKRKFQPDLPLEELVALMKQKVAGMSETQLEDVKAMLEDVFPRDGMEEELEQQHSKVMELRHQLRAVQAENAFIKERESSSARIASGNRVRELEVENSELKAKLEVVNSAEVALRDKLRSMEDEGLRLQADLQVCKTRVDVLRAEAEKKVEQAEALVASKEKLERELCFQIEQIQVEAEKSRQNAEAVVTVLDGLRLQVQDAVRNSAQLEAENSRLQLQLEDHFQSSAVLELQLTLLDAENSRLQLDDVQLHNKVTVLEAEITRLQLQLQDAVHNSAQLVDKVTVFEGGNSGLQLQVQDEFFHLQDKVRVLEAENSSLKLEQVRSSAQLRDRITGVEAENSELQQQLQHSLKLKNKIQKVSAKNSELSSKLQELEGSFREAHIRLGEQEIEKRMLRDEIQHIRGLTVANETLKEEVQVLKSELEALRQGRIEFVQRPLGQEMQLLSKNFQTLLEFARVRA